MHVCQSKLPTSKNDYSLKYYSVDVCTQTTQLTLPYVGILHLGEVPQDTMLTNRHEHDRGQLKASLYTTALSLWFVSNKS